MDKPANLMSMKEWLLWFPPPRSTTALLLSSFGFCGRLVLAHFTHSPTLLVDGCHALCRLLGLITTLIAFKYERADERTEHEGRLRNTFGWARIEVVGRLCVSVLFASFGFALIVGALQTGVHSSHGQPPRWPLVTLAAGVTGIVLRILEYLLLGGRELSYGRRLSFSEKGEVVLKAGGVSEPVLAHVKTDISSSLFVIAAALTTYWAGDVARIVDPILSAIACCALVSFNYPHMRAAGMMLLQTVPEGLGTCTLRSAALKVPGVLALHELHVWQFHKDMTVATAHIFYSDAESYMKSSAMVIEVFKKHGITLVTLQPEFASASEGDCGTGIGDLSSVDNSCSQPCAAACTARRCCEPPTNSSRSSSVPSTPASTESGSSEISPMDKIMKEKELEKKSEESDKLSDSVDSGDNLVKDNAEATIKGDDNIKSKKEVNNG